MSSRTSKRLREESQKETDAILRNSPANHVVRPKLSPEAKKANQEFKDSIREFEEKEMKAFDEQLKKETQEKNKTPLQKAGEKVKGFFKKANEDIANYNSGIEAMNPVQGPEKALFNKMAEVLKSMGR
ncbi:MAG: hypothetical protein BWY78_00579 [Alphaproteobacteria bacterium ADurb.Bin438]|nr:MAG: hypothetical protein BWY78_00579 [Alphaproteobacteria bacterium ADurb.Bin438]